MDRLSKIEQSNNDSTRPDRISPPRCRQREWRRALALFLCFAGFYLLTTSGHFYAVDEETIYVLTESIGARGTFALPRGAWGLVLSPQSPEPGPAYSIFPPGQAFAALPLFFIGQLVAPLFPPDAEGYVLRFFVSLLGSFVTAAMVALLYRLARLLGYGGRVALALAVIYGLATTAWPQGRTFFAEPLTALLLVFGLYGVRRGTDQSAVGSRQSAVGRKWADSQRAIGHSTIVTADCRLPTADYFLARPRRCRRRRLAGRQAARGARGGVGDTTGAGRSRFARRSVSAASSSRRRMPC